MSDYAVNVLGKVAAALYYAEQNAGSSSHLVYSPTM
jgi:hypothetical protein